MITEDYASLCQIVIVAYLLLWKAMLHATPSNRLPVNALRNSPALYAFDMPEIYAEQTSDSMPDLCYNRYGSDELLMLQ